MTLLSLFGLWDNRWPPYASYLLLELYTASGGNYVRLVYNGKQLMLPGCDKTEWQSCSWKQFSKLVERYSPTSHDFATACSSTCLSKKQVWWQSARWLERLVAFSLVSSFFFVFFYFIFF
eukprot:TRINITY_DN605_c0_g1_i2.p2 TRINITY_DN605_c0_g1~~TRINITY_DN605_c0_g1_i2.p2  ORF type:complete len:120 (-),score=29.14 TRINITY_DN605_c0_g1_i2:59-418(-)